MHVFCIIVDKHGGTRSPYQSELTTRATQLLPFPAHRDPINRWSASNGRVQFYGWTRGAAGPAFHIGADGGFAALDGWIGPAPANAEQIYHGSVDGVPNVGAAAGEFVAVCATPDGVGLCRRNIAGASPLYVAETADVSVIANRASLAAHMAGAARLRHDPTFHAINIAIGWQLRDQTMHRGVKAVAIGQSVRFSPDGVAVIEPTDDPLYAPELRDKFDANPAGYWDDLFGFMCDTVGYLVARAAEAGPVTLRLSGGKDSRLLLALLLGAGVCDKIDVFVSRGAPGHADAEVAEIIARKFDLPFNRTSGARSASRIDTKLGDHSFLTEAAISPFDLCWHPEFSDRGTTLAGHEAGLRNGAITVVKSVDGFADWLSAHHKRFDALGLLTPEYQTVVRDIAAEIVARPAWRNTPVDNLPTWHRLTARMARWVAVVQSFESARGFAPHALAVDLPIISQYSLGEDIRGSELFHYEMMCRADPWLAHECPFAVQQWAPSLFDHVDTFAAPDPLQHSADGTPGLPASTVAFQVNRDRLFDWLLADRSHPVFEIVDIAALRRLANAEITEGRLLQCFWQVVQARAVLDVVDLATLAPWSADRQPIGLPPLAHTAAA